MNLLLVKKRINWILEECARASLSQGYRLMVLSDVPLLSHIK